MSFWGRITSLRNSQFSVGLKKNIFHSWDLIPDTSVPGRPSWLIYTSLGPLRGPDMCMKVIHCIRDESTAPENRLSDQESSYGHGLGEGGRNKSEMLFCSLAFFHGLHFSILRINVSIPATAAFVPTSWRLRSSFLALLAGSLSALSTETKRSRGLSRWCIRASEEKFGSKYVISRWPRDKRNPPLSSIFQPFLLFREASNFGQDERIMESGRALQMVRFNLGNVSLSKAMLKPQDLDFGYCWGLEIKQLHYFLVSNVISKSASLSAKTSSILQNGFHEKSAFWEGKCPMQIHPEFWNGVTSSFLPVLAKSDLFTQRTHHLSYK